MDFADETTRAVIGVNEVVARLAPRSVLGEEALARLEVYGSGREAAWRAEIARLESVDDWWTAEVAENAADALGELPSMSRPLALLEEGMTLDDVALFEVKRFLYWARPVLEAAEPLADVDAGWSARLEELMFAIDPADAPSPRFRLASELDERLAEARDELSATKQRTREYRAAIEDELVDAWGGAFDVRGRYTPPEGVTPDDDRLAPVDERQFRVVDNRLEDLIAELSTATKRRTEIEADVRGVLSNQLRESLDLLRDVRRSLGELDGRIARVEQRRHWGGSWGEWTAARAPLEIVDGRHPALLESLPESDVRAILLELTKPATVVTGPNMGGKSLLLRLVGICQWCAQHALAVPARNFRFHPVRRIVYVGAEEPGIGSSTGLSAFGREIRRVVEQRSTGDDALWLLDEFGRGTHPAEGAAIACDLVRDLSRSGNRILAATHFPALATLANVDHLRITGLTERAPLEGLGQADLTEIEAALRRAMDYRPVRVDAGEATVPRDARLVARALGLRLGGGDDEEE